MLRTEPTPIDKEAGPPFFDRWSSFYWLILAIHAVIIFAFWIFTWVFS